MVEAMWCSIPVPCKTIPPRTRIRKVKTLQIRFPDRVVEVPFGTPLVASFPFETAAVLVNGELQSLRHPMTSNAHVIPVSLSDRLGHRVYRRTLGFLLDLARRQTSQSGWHRGPSWGGAHAYDTEAGQPVPSFEVAHVKSTLRALVDANLDLEPVDVPLAEALALLNHPDDADVRLFLAQKNPAAVTLVRCGDLWSWEPEVLLPSTGLATVWDLESSPTGLVLRFPAKQWPLVLGTWVSSPALARAHGEARRWAKIQNVLTIPRLNAVAESPSAAEAFVQGAEAVHERGFAALADEVVARGARIVLLAGPSSSGKTTSAKRLAVQLQACGRKPLVVSLDDYFVNRDDTPKDAEGRYDFEALEAMDRRRLASDLEKLLSNQTAELPMFDFKTGQRRPEGRPFHLGPEGILILEGIHGLNPSLWPGRPEGACYTLFVSALTSLTREGRTRISTSDHRLIRRIVRDRQFRGYSALQTLRQWSSVRRGEDNHLFPFQDQADGVFNSALPYEFAVLREAALPLLEAVPASEPEYPQARFLISFLESFHPIPIRLVPPFSLLREFLGQSGFRY